MSDGSPRTESGGKGLFRTFLAGPGATLTDAFRRLREDAGRIYPTVTIPGRGLLAANIRIPSGEGEGSWELISIRDEVFVVVTNCRYIDARLERVLPEDFIEFHFTLTGPVQLEGSGAAHFDLRDPLMVVCRQGAGADYTVWCGPGPRRLVSVYFRQEFLTDVVGILPAVDGSILSEIVQTLPGRIACYQLPIRIGIVDILRELIEMPFTQHRRLLYAEAKVMELLCHCADDLVAHRDVAPAMDMFTGRELEMFEEARRILSSHFSPTPTISYLARAVGTNTSKLKRGFKLIYGTTIFELGHQYRMKRALELLATEKLAVGTVADMIGYQHQASFASAFKDYYGFLPKDARKRHGGA